MKILSILFILVLSCGIFAQEIPPPPLMKGETQEQRDASVKTQLEAARREADLPKRYNTTPPTETTKLLTNESVIEMVAARLPDSVIISKIKVSLTEFDTEIAALKSLNEAKVPESVISAMIEKSAAKSVSVAETPKEVSVKTEKTFAPLPNPDFSESTEKQRYKQPAQIQIGASADKISPLIIRAFQSLNYQLDDDSSRRLVFSKEVSGMGNQILANLATGDSNARYHVQVTLAELSDSTNVIVSISLKSQNAFGRTIYNSLDKNKKTRRELDQLLLAAKDAAERQP